MEIHSSTAPAAILHLERLRVLAHRRQRRMYRITTRRWEAAAQENFNLDLRFFSSYGNHTDTETQREPEQSEDRHRNSPFNFVVCPRIIFDCSVPFVSLCLCGS